MTEEKKKNRTAVALGRRGGKRRAAVLSAQELSEQGRRAAAARWGKSKPSEVIPEGPPIAPPTGIEAGFDGRDSNAILTLREQGYEVGEPARHPDGVMRVNVRSHDTSAWVAAGGELLDLAAGRISLEDLMNRRRGELRGAAAGGQK